MVERGVDVSHPTILRWIQRFVPEFEKRWNCDARQVGTSWRVDETYITATHAAITELKESGVRRRETKVRPSKYLNNLIEQDQRRVKQRTYPMRGFKRFANAAVTISGIELVHKIRKGQFNITKLTNWVGGRAPHVWEAILDA